MCSPRVGAPRVGPSAAAREAEAGPLHDRVAVHGVLDVHPVAERRQLGVGGRLRRVLDDVRGDAGRPAALLGLGRRLRAGPRRDERLQLPPPRQPLVEREVGQVGAAQQTGQGGPGALVLRHDRHPAVVARGGEHPVRAVALLVVALGPEVGRRVDPRGQQHGAQEVDRRLGLGEVEVLALARAPPVVEGGQQRGDRQVGRGVVGVGAVGPDRVAVRPAGGAVEAR